MNTLRLMELSELTTLALGGNKTRMLYSPSTVKADFKKLEMVCFLSALGVDTRSLFGVLGS